MSFAIVRGALAATQAAGVLVVLVVQWSFAIVRGALAATQAAGVLVVLVVQ